MSARIIDDEVYARWRPINRGPWRFAYDEMRERGAVERVMRMLKHVSPRRKQVYTLIGNEPFAACKQRVDEVIAWGGEPYAQPIMKLNTLNRRPWVRFDWNVMLLRHFQRWCNYARRAGVAWEEYNSSIRSSRHVATEAGMFASLYDPEADAIASYNDAVREVGKRVKAGAPIPDFFLSDRAAE